MSDAYEPQTGGSNKPHVAVSTDKEELTDREIAILATTELFWEKYRDVTDATQIAAGLRNIVENDDRVIPDAPTRDDVELQAALVREFARFLEERVAPLAQEDDNATE